MIFLTSYFYEILELFADFVLTHLIDQIFQSHKEGELVGVALEPDIINFFGIFLLVSVQVPF